MKKTISIILSSALIFSLTTSSFAYEESYVEKVYEQSFPDVPETHWAFEYIEDLVERNVLNGYLDGKFYPNLPVNREAFAKILTLASGQPEPTDTSVNFADVTASMWSAPYINASRNYITAYQTNGVLYFRPTESAVREDMAIAIVKLKGYDVSNADTSYIEESFSDFDKISEIAKPYIAVAVERGVISGFTDGTFRPQSTITRAESCAMLWRAFQYGSDDKVVLDDLDLDNSSDELFDDVLDDTSNDDFVADFSDETLEDDSTSDVFDDELVEDEELFEEVLPVAYTETLNYNISNNNGVFDTLGDYYHMSGNSTSYSGTQIAKISNGKSTIVTSSSDFAFEITEGEILSSSSTKMIYFDTVLFYGITYNSSNDEVYFVVRSYDTSASYSYHAIFALSDLETPVFSEILSRNFSGNYSVYGTNDALIVSDLNKKYYELDTNTNRLISIDSLSNYTPTNFEYFNNSLISMNTPIYASTSPSFQLYHYSSWTSYFITDFTGVIYDFAIFDDSIYFISNTGLHKLTQSGTRYKATLVLAFADVEIQDRTAISDVKSFIFDDNSDIIFFDSTNSAIRKINMNDLLNQ